MAEKLAPLFCQSQESSELYRQILTVAGELLRTKSQSLFLHDEGTGILREVASVGDTVDLIDFVPFQMGSGLSAWVGQEKRPIRISRRGRRSRESGAAFLAVPLLSDNELVGVITFTDQERNSFGEDDVTTAETMAMQIAAGLERRVYQEQLASLNDRIYRAEERLAATLAELESCKNNLSRQKHAISLLDRIDGPLDVQRHVIEFLRQEYQGADRKLVERLAVLDSECERIGMIADKIRMLANHQPAGAEITFGALNGG